MEKFKTIQLPPRSCGDCKYHTLDLIDKIEYVYCEEICRQMTSTSCCEYHKYPDPFETYVLAFELEPEEEAEI